MSEQAVHDWIRKAIANNDVVVFMKGTKTFPQCGFSSQVAQILGRTILLYKRHPKLPKFEGSTTV